MLLVKPDVDDVKLRTGVCDNLTRIDFQRNLKIFFLQDDDEEDQKERPVNDPRNIQRVLNGEACLTGVCWGNDLDKLNNASFSLTLLLTFDRFAIGLRLVALRVLLRESGDTIPLGKGRKNSRNSPW